MTTDDAYVTLCNAIIEQAVMDWRHICIGKCVPGETLNTIRRFFHSEYCEMLCGRLNPLGILARLEREREILLLEEQEGGNFNVELG